MSGLNQFTVFLSHYDTNTKNVITDETPSTYGDPSLSSIVYKFDSGSLELETADHLIYPDSADYDFNTDNFTIDCWIYPTSFAIDYQGIVTTVGNYAWDWGSTAWHLCMRSTGVIELRGSASSGGAFVTSGSLVVTLNQWNHIAVVRKGTGGTDLNIAIDGTFGDAPATGNVNILSGNVFRVGCVNSNIPTSNYFTGYVDELRIQNGEAYWTSNFIPETEAYWNDSIYYKFNSDFRTRLLQTLIWDSDLRLQAPIQYLTWDSDLRTRLSQNLIINSDLRTRLGLLFTGDLRTQSTEYFIFNSDLRTGKLPTTVPTGYDSWTEYAVDLGYSDPQDYYTTAGYNELKPSPLSSVTLYINGVQNTEVNLLSIKVNITSDQESTATFELPRYIDKTSYTLSNTLSELKHHNIVEIFYNTYRIFIGKVTGIDGEISKGADGIIQVKATATINSHFCPHYTKTIKNSDGTAKTETIFLSGNRVLNLPPTTARASIYDIQNLSLAWQNNILDDLSTDSSTKTYYVESSEYNNSNLNETNTTKKITEEEANGIEVDLGYASFSGIDSGYFQITTWEELFNFKPLKNKEYFFVLNEYTTTSTIITLTTKTKHTSFTEKENNTTVTTPFPCFLGQSPKDVLDCDPLIEADSFLITIYWNRKKDYKVQISKSDIDDGLYENANITTEQDETDIGVDWDDSFTDYYLTNQIKLGSYLIGSSPYYKISCDNGSFVTVPTYEVGNTYFLAKLDETYDYIDYAKQYAQASYWKLPKIQTSNDNNGDKPVEETNNRGNLNVILTFDAWKFYNIKLNNKININNTKQTNEWINHWGFPFNVNSINFNTLNMTVTLGLDSKKSSVITKAVHKAYVQSFQYVPQASVKWTSGLLSKKEGDNIVNPLVSTQTSLPTLIFSSAANSNEQDVSFTPEKPSPTPIKKKRIAVIYKSAQDIVSESIERNGEQIDKYGYLAGGNRNYILSEFLNTETDE